jgi:hypothetical protein
MTTTRTKKIWTCLYCMQIFWAIQAVSSNQRKRSQIKCSALVKAKLELKLLLPLCYIINLCSKFVSSSSNQIRKKKLKYAFI